MASRAAGMQAADFCGRVIACSHWKTRPSERSARQPSARSRWSSGASVRGVLWRSFMQIAIRSDYFLGVRHSCVGSRKSCATLERSIPRPFFFGVNEYSSDHNALYLQYHVPVDIARVSTHSTLDSLFARKITAPSSSLARSRQSPSLTADPTCWASTQGTSLSPRSSGWRTSSRRLRARATGSSTRVG